MAQAEEVMKGSIREMTLLCKEEERCMKQLFSFLVMALLLMVAGCKRSLIEVDNPEESVRLITARMESDNTTKTVLTGPVDGIYYPYWSKGDELAVYADGVSAPDKYSLVEGEGSVTASFKGKVTGAKLFALYPYSFRSEEGVTNGVMTLELPSVQVYKQGSFADDSYPMVAVSTTDELSFKNLCAVLKVSMTGESMVKTIRFVAHDTQMMVSGKATVEMDYSSEPELVMSEEGKNEVVLQTSGVQLTMDEPTVFYIVIPAGTYKGGFSLEINTFTGIITKSTDADVSFSRSQLRAIPAFECTTSGTIDPDSIPSNQIWYKSIDGGIIVLSDNADAFDQHIVSNVYENGWGIITFEGPVKRVGTINGWYSAIFQRAIDVRLPDSVEEIGNATFRGSSISSFRTPDNLTKVGEIAFSECSNLTRIYGKGSTEDEKGLILPDGTLVAYAMASLESDLVIPEGVKSISGELFRNCTSLESVSLPSSVEDIGDNAFAYCTSLREFRGESPVIYDSQTIISKAGVLAGYAGKGVTDYAIPYGVRLESAMCGFKDLKTVTFPDYLKGTLSSCFADCDNLEFFYGPEASEDHHCWIINFMGIGLGLWNITPVCPTDYAPKGFDAIVSLGASRLAIERLTLEDRVQMIDDYTLGPLMNLRYLRLPSSLRSLGRDNIQYLTSLDSLFVRSYTPPTYSEDEWAINSSIREGLRIFIPEGTMDLYSQAAGWSRYSSCLEEYKYDDLEVPDYYISTDYSHDGEITNIQTATEGNGIEVVLMGDAFSDRQIADGTYAAAIQRMVDAFFSEEPYTTYRNLFNVNMVTVVSATEGYENGGQALGTWFGSGTQVGGDDNKCMEYARKVVPDDKMDNALIIVAMNEDAYAGTCYMYYPSSGDYGNGLSVAYFPTSSVEATFNGLVRHEAGGHGFSKLGDEYAYEYMGAISQAAIEDAQNMATYGWWKNVDFTGDPAKVKWAKFLSDERYQYDGLGMFEGGFTYWSGVWRPTEESIMNHNKDGFNAPSREAIWYRIHKLAYGDTWEYNYEDFVAYDAKNRKTSAATSSARPNNYVERRMEPTHPPVLMHRRWNDPVPERELRPAR